MPQFLEYTPEALNSYRISVADWLQKSLRALDSFTNETTGSFFRDSKQSDASKTLTTPARSYMALVSTSRHCAPKQSGGKKTWVDKFGQYASRIPVAVRKGALINEETKRLLNNFELAKLADLATVGTRLNDQIVEFSVAFEKKRGRPIGAAVLFDVQRQFWDRLVARGPEDALTEEEFIRALERRLEVSLG